MSVKHICYCIPSFFLVLDSKIVLRRGRLLFLKGTINYTIGIAKSNQFVGVNVKKRYKHFFSKLIQHMISIKNDR